ncbi:MAG TPA: outer membrane protein transport protein [Gemmatimonadaceae bacterium]|nr:outer membrane protein transport protein [Gemmatimonadaceae bacterium]
MRVRRFSMPALAALLLTLPAAAMAQGFALNEVGTCGVARGYATTGAPCKDATTIFWNPAFAAMLPGNSLVIGGASVDVTGSFVRDSALGRYEGNVPMEYPPHFYFTHRQNERMSWGLGVYVPYGLTSQWHDDFPGRFQALKASLASIYFQPNIAWKLNDRWMIGGGPVIAHSSVELVQSVDLAEQAAAPNPLGGVITFGELGIAQGTEFARGTLKGSAYGYGFALGVYGRLSDHWTMGARYLSSINFNYSNGKATFAQVPTGLTLAAGNVFGPGGTSLPAGTPVDALVASQFTAGGALVAQDGTTELAHPDQAELGFAYDGFDRWLLSADYAWMGFKRFHELDIKFSNPALGTKSMYEDYHNSSAIRLGAQYSLRNDWQLRFGFAGVAAAAPDVTVTPILPDQDRANYTLGLGVPLTRSLTLDAAYVHVWTSGRRGRIGDRPSRNLTADDVNDGVFNLAANVFSFSLKASF